MQDFRPLVWVALLLVGIASFWLAYRFGKEGLDDDRNVKVDLRTQRRTSVVTACVGVGSISLGYVLFDICSSIRLLPQCAEA